MTSRPGLRFGRFEIRDFIAAAEDSKGELKVTRAESGRRRACEEANIVVYVPAWLYTTQSTKEARRKLTAPRTRRQARGEGGEKSAYQTMMTVVIHNVYNSPQSAQNRTSVLPIVRKLLERATIGEQVVLGDFNLHHSMWGGEGGERS